MVRYIFTRCFHSFQVKDYNDGLYVYPYLYRGVVWDRLTAVHKKYACDEFLEIFPLMEKHCGYNRNNIPQV